MTTIITQAAAEQLLADLADVLHIASAHPTSGVCHGSCEGGGTRLEYELADAAFDYVLDDLDLCVEQDEEV